MLTGLANRGLLMDRLAEALSRAERSGRLVAVLFLDLDNLKSVNDSYGHDAGDLLIQTVGQRLAVSIRRHETAARLGGDEFVVVLEDLKDEDDAANAQDRIAQDVRQPIEASQNTINSSASIGVALYPRDGVTPASLLRAADQAMYAAKRISKRMESYTLTSGLLQ